MGMKAQVAIEFIIIFAVFLVALMVVILAAWNNVVSIDKSAVEFEANRILNLVFNKVNTAYLEGDGFSINLSVPERIGLMNYTVEFEGSNVWLEVNGFSCSRRILTPNITGNIGSGTNVIRNVNGEIVIS